VLLAAHSLVAADVRWWIWTCALGVAMGVFGLLYVPYLKRKRARLAAERAAAQTESADAESPAAGTQPSSEYVSRDSGSNTVSSTETPGKSTRS
jgi:hypothetical protein